MTSQSTIHVGLSQAFHNKQNTSGSKSAFGSSFVPSEITLQALVDHITSGKAWTQGYFKGQSRSKETFISSQTLALDLDENVSVTQALEHNLIRDYAAIVHPSPSHTPEWAKTRVIFILDEPVDDANRWEAMQRALIGVCLTNQYG